MRRWISSIYIEDDSIDAEVMDSLAITMDDFGVKNSLSEIILLHCIPLALCMHNTTIFMIACTNTYSYISYTFTRVSVVLNIVIIY